MTPQEAVDEQDEETNRKDGCFYTLYLLILIIILILINI